MKKNLNIFIFFILFFPLGVESIGRKYAPEEGTFDRRKRIVIQPICRLVKETIVPGDVVCEYQSQKKGDKNKEIYLGAPGNNCQKQITCPKK
ncbi:MAG: hypothetical protein CMM95_03245 [Rickettsiales bacterium]|nr:hypothetical protein [Rickettsiales bacterium]|tara:strand:+ start:459 stop:734 length:276 start_codon:yes stop_codon:yes gene_type:complete